MRITLKDEKYLAHKAGDLVQIMTKIGYVMIQNSRIVDCASPAQVGREVIVQTVTTRNRRERDEVMKSLGLTKVRGAVSGKVYWE